MNLAPKSAPLGPNTAVTLVWGAKEINDVFSLAEIRSPISLSLNVQSSCDAVVYVNVGYVTDVATVTQLDRAFVAAVPKSAVQSITAKTVPALAQLPPNIRALTVSLITAGSGSILVSPDIGAPQSASPQPLLGGDTILAADYTKISFGGIYTLVEGVATLNIYSYTVPLGKRATVNLLSFQLPPTPYKYGDLYVSANIAGIPLVLISSASDMVIQTYRDVYTLAEGENITITLGNQNIGVSCSAVAYGYLLEVF